ncbi:hypothetical protein BASA50_003850 [Batrachochytrium salamandrivorans]|uniref:Thioredoxin domain-containing protein n=1 Tax=Batrachochytrium salamandrivorans TaxID=1357716 RepID=A0ABQ8FHN7_9FUNG|nr:hypothetical protein BASA62_000587 [Batrachochytrium salamandrivorans]KAH6590625.1 hypothetical protein BASA61_005216 [Batrachochytrium salamandrivorans]KAH6598236.1 hypothetical protein BASA50_003850 [Batrachochytrium salamandrivorans]KAH9251457.1 hypothetical protein BASA81_010694 [Batrachochytrium salamandrivorans]KAH9265861.1 hypothetical protein BASA84_001408 [Batrachochytrium salamandrivorans]
MRAVRITDERDFDNVLGSTIATSQGPVFVLFFGTEVSTTGESWCPDCVIADPLIRRTIARIPDAVLVEAPAGGRGAEYKGSLYRSHPDIKLVAVPTLILWGKQGPKKRLVEVDCSNPSLLDEFISS